MDERTNGMDGWMSHIERLCSFLATTVLNTSNTQQRTSLRFVSSWNAPPYTETLFAPTPFLAVSLGTAIFPLSFALNAATAEHISRLTQAFNRDFLHTDDAYKFQMHSLCCPRSAWIFWRFEGNACFVLCNL